MRKLFLERSLGLLLRAFVRLGLQPAVLFEKNFYFPFRLFQLLAAGCGELNTFFKEFQGLLKRHVAFLEFVHNLFQPLETIFKSGQFAETPKLILTLSEAERRVFFTKQLPKDSFQSRLFNWRSPRLV